MTPAVCYSSLFFFFLVYRRMASIFFSPPHLFLGGRILPPKHLACQKVSCEIRRWLSLVEDGGSHKNSFCAWDLSRTGTTKRIGATTTPRCCTFGACAKPQWRTHWRMCSSRLLVYLAGYGNSATATDGSSSRGYPNTTPSKLGTMSHDALFDPDSPRLRSSRVLLP
jgi:hypothetical protein